MPEETCDYILARVWRGAKLTLTKEKRYTEDHAYRWIAERYKTTEQAVRGAIDEVEMANRKRVALEKMPYHQLRSLDPREYGWNTIGELPTCSLRLLASQKKIGRPTSWSILKLPRMPRYLR
jgi:hypothetical protein